LRYLKFFIIGFLVIVIIQIGTLIYLEKVYFADNASYSSTKVEDNTTPQPSKLKLILEQGSTNITASYDGKYISYLKDNNLFVANSQETNKIKVSANNGMEIAYYKWIYDRNRIIIAERPINYKNGTFYKLYYYDLDSKSKVEIANEMNNKSIQIPINSSNEKITSIEMSTLTNVIYIKLSSSNGSSRIYSINIMAQQKNVNTVTHSIGKIASTKKDDVLLYENLNDKKVYQSGSNTPVTIDGKSNFSLLGVDSKDNIYLALTDNKKSKLIYYGNISNKNWNKVNVNTEANINNIYMNFKGQVFINDNSKSIMTELLTGKGTSYHGKILDMYEGGIVSEENSEIIETIFQ